MQYEVDTYKLEYIEETGQYYISFKDSVKSDCRIEISKDIFETYIISKKSYIKIKNQKDRHEETDNLTEEEIYFKSINKEKGTEDKAIINIYVEQLNNGKKELTEIQRRRIELNIENGISIRELAKKEMVRTNQIEKSITLGLKKLKNFFKK